MCLSFYHNLSSPHCLFQRRDVNDPENICLMRIASGWTLILEGSGFLLSGEREPPRPAPPSPLVAPLLRAVWSRTKRQTFRV